MTEVLLIVFLVLVALLGIFRPRIKGYFGELKVALWLSFLNKSEYKTLNNILIQKDGRSSQIDHLIVSVYGIFVIETKNYKGWIHGNEKSEYWLQTIYKHKNRFRNPVTQCQGHVRAVKRVLPDYNHVAYYPIVVFTGQATLENVYSHVPVVYTTRLIRTIKKYATTSYLTVEEVDDIVAILSKAHSPGRKARKTHNRKARKNSLVHKRRESSGLCPRCGGSLVLRSGKYGKFQGCSNFPKCKYSKSM